jgi:hypothetical protein
MSDSVVLKVNGRCRWSTVILIAAVLAALIAQTAHALEPCSDPDTFGLLATELVFSDSACPGDSEAQCITVINTVNAYRAFDEQYDLYTVTQYISDDLVDALGMDKLVVKVSNKLTSPASTSDTVVAQGSASPETSTSCNGSSTQGSTTSTSGAIGAGFEGTPKIGLVILSSL